MGRTDSAMGKFCTECGAKVEGQKFCSECGTPNASAGAATPVQPQAPPAAAMTNLNSAQKKLVKQQTSRVAVGKAAPPSSSSGSSSSVSSSSSSSSEAKPAKKAAAKKKASSSSSGSSSDEKPAKKAAAKKKKAPSSSSSDEKPAKKKAKPATPKASPKAPPAQPPAAAVDMSKLNSRERRLLKRKMDANGGVAPVPVAAAATPSKPGLNDEPLHFAPPEAAPAPATPVDMAGLNSRERRLLKRKMDANGGVAPVEAAPEAAGEAMHPSRRQKVATEHTSAWDQQQAAWTKPAPEIRAPTAASGDEASRCFLGNLPFTVDEETVRSVFAECCDDPCDILEVKWITDKESGKFYGTAFLTFKSKAFADKAVAMNGNWIMDRSIKVEHTKAPPKFSRQTERQMQPKPPGCTKLFVGNVAYEATEEQLWELFAKCGDVVSIRWLTHQDSGEFKGCGFVDYSNTDAVDEAIKLNGTEIAGRRMRVDYDTN